LRYHQRGFVLDGRRRSLMLGGGFINGRLFDDRRVSRQNARVEQRRDRFVLIDHSTHGARVAFEGMRKISLRMEETLLFGRGHIILGRAYHSNDDLGILEFEVL
jgi:hypothetical protein